MPRRFDVLTTDGRTLHAYDTSYGGSTPHPDRNIASDAADVAAVVDALGIDRFAVAGHSGGGSRALASAALDAGRVDAVLAISTMAPYDADGLDWFAGMAASGVAGLSAALTGREEKERFEAADAGGEPGFTESDAATIKVPTLLVHDEDDLIAPIGHGEWLSRRCPSAELQRYAGDGRISAMRHAEDALEWLSGHAS